MRHFFSVITTFLVFCTTGFTQLLADSSRLWLADIKSVRSDILKENRTVYIYRPAVDPAEQLPVLYLLDGDIQMSSIAAQVQYMAGVYGMYPNMMIVGIANYKYDRFKDLTPTNSLVNFQGQIESSWKTSGGAGNFLSFIEQELIPWVQKNYSTNSYKIISGHSLGALTVLHAFNSNKETFNAYIAVSPSMWWDNENELKQLRTKRSAFSTSPILYISDGNEGGNFHQAVLKTDSLYKRLMPDSFRYKYKSYPDETHGSVQLPSHSDALRFIFKDWQPGQGDSSVEAIKAKYKRLSEKNKIRLLIPANILLSLAFENMQRGIMKPAEEAATYLIENYPENIMGFVLKAEMYERSGDKVNALIWYKKVLTIRPEEPEILRRIKSLNER
jgi:predicted alpha/beta superfamily hydrolase